MRAGAIERAVKLFFICSPDNDLFQALGGIARRFDDTHAAIQSAPTGAGLLIFADHYHKQLLIVMPC